MRNPIVLTGTEESRPAWRSVHEGRDRDGHVDNACRTTQCQTVTGKAWQAWDMLCFKRTRRCPRRPLGQHKAPIIAIPVSMSASKRPRPTGGGPLGRRGDHWVLRAQCCDHPGEANHPADAPSTSHLTAITQEHTRAQTNALRHPDYLTPREAFEHLLIASIP